MIYVKKFDNDTDRERYIKNNFVSPHLFMNTQNRNVNYFQKYKRLDYISSTATGGQYIDLGCHLMENTDDIRIDIKFNVKEHGKDGMQQSTLIASQPEVSPYPGFTMRINAYNITDTRNVVTFNNKWVCSTDWISYKNGSKIGYSFSYMIPMGDITYKPVGDGTTTLIGQIYNYSILVDNIPLSQVNDCTCTLFCAYDGSNNPFRYIAADLYYLRFIKGNKIIRNLIPVQRKSDNEVGLWDMENQVFYTSQGDQPFVAGSIIE